MPNIVYTIHKHKKKDHKTAVEFVACVTYWNPVRTSVFHIGWKRRQNQLGINASSNLDLKTKGSETKSLRKGDRESALRGILRKSFQNQLPENESLDTPVSMNIMQKITLSCQILDIDIGITKQLPKHGSSVESIEKKKTYYSCTMRIVKAVEKGLCETFCPGSNFPQQELNKKYAVDIGETCLKKVRKHIIHLFFF